MRTTRRHQRRLPDPGKMARRESLPQGALLLSGNVTIAEVTSTQKHQKSKTFGSAPKLEKAGKNITTGKTERIITTPARGRV